MGANPPMWAGNFVFPLGRHPPVRLCPPATPYALCKKLSRSSDCIAHRTEPPPSVILSTSLLVFVPGGHCTRPIRPQGPLPHN